MGYDKNIDLTERQESFVRLYVETGHATNSYKRAFNNHTATTKTLNERASRLLAERKIIARIEYYKHLLAERTTITRQMILDEYAKIAFSDIAHYHNTWIDRKAFEELTDTQKTAIKSIKTRTRMVKVRSDETIQLDEVFIELHSKLDALNAICRMQGFDAPQKVEQKVTTDQPITFVVNGENVERTADEL